MRKKHEAANYYAWRISTGFIGSVDAGSYGAIVFIFAVLATRRLSVENPGKLQNFMEWAVEFVAQSDFQYNGYEER